MNQKPTSYILAALGCLPVLVFAVPPTITSVSGTVQQGQILTITGASMVQEDRTNWDPFFTASTSGFEGVSLFADGYQEGTTGNWGTCMSYDSNMKLMGNQSLKMHLSGQHIRLADGSGLASCSSDWKVQANTPGTTWTDVYFRAYSRWNNTSWATQDTKYWWLLAANTPITGQRWSFDTNADGSPPTQFEVQVLPNGRNNFGKIPGGAMQNDRWYLFEGYTRVTNPPASAGSYPIKMWIDNQLIIDVTDLYGATPNNAGFGWESNTNLYDTPAGWVSDHWQDGFAVSKTRIGPASLIEISNCSTYGSGVKLYQAPEFLSDQSSQVKVDVTGLGGGPYVLWVTNNRNERSQPFFIGTGTPSCAQSALPAPNNLRVQ
jgi:hypothetical protein